MKDASRSRRMDIALGLAMALVILPTGAAAKEGLLPPADPETGPHAVEVGAAFTLGAYHRVSSYYDGDYQSRTQGGFAPGFVLWADYMTKYLGGGLDFRMIFPAPNEACASGVCVSKSNLSDMGVDLKRATSFAILPFLKVRIPVWIAEPYLTLKFGYLFYNDDPDVKGYGNGLGLGIALGSLFRVAQGWAVTGELEYFYGSTWDTEDKKLRYSTQAINIHLGAAYLF